MLIKTYRLRLYVLYLVPVFFMLGLVVRLYYLQVVDRAIYQSLADRQHFKQYDIIPMRGKILDANGHDLAGSVILDKAHLNINQLPAENRDKLLPDLASALATVLNNPQMAYDEILFRLSGKLNKSPFLARDLDENKKMELIATITQERFLEAGLGPGFFSFVPENNRQYSRGSLAAHVVGYTKQDHTGDNEGMAGVERTYNDELRGREEKYTVRKSATNNPMEPADPELIESTFGHTIKLTIDESIQAVTQNVLAQGVEKSQADGGVAICYHVKTGEILSMASYPSYNLDNLGDASAEQRRNRAVSDAIEPGSVMKIITFASLFDDEKIEPFDVINCEGGHWVMPGTGRVITDSHQSGTVSVSEVFQHSSNIGTIKAARAFEEAAFYQHLKKFGFGEKTGIDLPGESRGVLSNYKDWSSMSMSSLPMGYEIQLTAVQVVGAVGAIANKGMYMQPHVVKEILDHNGNTVKKIEPKFVKSVADPIACRKIVNLMELVVEKGTAKAAKLDGYRVGGKTGTTKKLDPKTHKYENSYIASFCGVAPIEDPEVCIYVYVDNPRGNKVYGGQVAAPVFREIAREAMRVLRVPEHRNVMPADDFRLTLDKVRNKIEGRVPMEVVADFDGGGSDDLSPDSVPNLRHLSLAEAVKKAASVGMEVRHSGSGIVVSQDPPPAETIEGDRIINITLTDSRQFIAYLADNYAEEMGLEKPDVLTMSPGGISPITSVSLALKVGDEQIDVPVSLAQSSWPAAKTKTSVVPQQEDAPLPDLDQFANQPVDIRAGKQSWKNGVKEMENQKQQEAEQSRTGRNVGEEEESNVPNMKPSSLPVPDFATSDDLDPARHAITPIDIQTPKKLPKRQDSLGDSLYNM